MIDKKTVLVTGVADYWGARVAERLAQMPGIQVLGLDSEPLENELPGVDFIQADIRSPLIVDLLRVEQVHTVCHLKFKEQLKPSEELNDLNVLGAMKLLDACAKAGVEKVVIRSSTAVYGAHPDNSALLTEESALRGSKNYGYSRDWLELEAFYNDFHSQYPRLDLTILRFANVIGPMVDSPIMRFFKLNPPITLLGFDPVMQFIHEDDAVAALAFAVENDVPGVYNFAADGPMPLSRALRLARRKPAHVFHPLAYFGAKWLRRSQFAPDQYVPLEWDYLRYPWVADLTKLHEQLGFSAHYLAEEALRELAGPRQPEKTVRPDESPAYDEERLRDIIERRRQARDQQSDVTPSTK